MIAFEHLESVLTSLTGRHHRRHENYRLLRVARRQEYRNSGKESDNYTRSNSLRLLPAGLTRALRTALRDTVKAITLLRYRSHGLRCTLLTRKALPLLVILHALLAINPLDHLQGVLPHHRRTARLIRARKAMSIKDRHERRRARQSDVADRFLRGQSLARHRSINIS